MSPTLTGLFIAIACLPAANPHATGPLRPHPENPQYFTDGSGKAVYLTGSHTWNNFQDVTGGSWFLPNLISRHGYEAYLDFLVSRNHNFIRLWMVEHAWDEKEKSRIEPHPWMRTGPGTALDGLPRFDLNRADQVFYVRLRERVIAARERGIYISVMLFGGMWGTEDRSTWKGHPFNRENNVNGIDGDANRDGCSSHTPLGKTRRRPRLSLGRYLSCVTQASFSLIGLAHEETLACDKVSQIRGFR